VVEDALGLVANAAVAGVLTGLFYVVIALFSGRR
jgi:hypothetical protein